MEELELLDAVVVLTKRTVASCICIVGEVGDGRDKGA